MSNFKIGVRYFFSSEGEKNWVPKPGVRENLQNTQFSSHGLMQTSCTHHSEGPLRCTGPIPKSYQITTPSPPPRHRKHTGNTRSNSANPYSSTRCLHMEITPLCMRCQRLKLSSFRGLCPLDPLGWTIFEINQEKQCHSPPKTWIVRAN